MTTKAWRRARLGLIATIVLVLGIFGAAGANAAGPQVTLGGGSPILILAGGTTANACTLGAIGHDQSGNLVGITAGHCGVYGQPVLSETWQGRGTLGKIISRRGKLDYAIIKFDPKLVRPTNHVGGVTIRGINTRAPGFPTVLCKQGRSTGHTCGVTWFSNGTSHATQMCIVSGDSGSPVVQGDRLVGIVNEFFGVACIGPETGLNIGTILRDAKHKHGTNPYVMTKFTPISASGR